MKKQLKRFGRILLLGGAMLFLGCQTADDLPHEEHSENHQGITMQRKSFKDFKRLPQLTKDVYKNKERFQGRGGELDTLYNFVIDSSTVRAMTQGNDTYYTMSISRGEANPAFFENLVVSEEPEGNRAFLVTYYPDDSYRERRAFHEFARFSGKMFTKEIDYNAIANKGGSGCEDAIVGFCDNGPAGTLSGNGCCSNQDGGAHIRYETVRICDGVIVYVYNDPENGGSSGGGGTSAPSGPSGPSSGGSTGGTGSGNPSSPGAPSNPGNSGGGYSGGGISVPPTYPGTGAPTGGGSTNGGGTAPDPGSPDPGNPYDGSQDYGGGSGGPNPGTGGGKKPMITGPVYIPTPPRTVAYLKIYLSQDQNNWLERPENIQYAALIYNYGARDNYSAASIDLARDLTELSRHETDRADLANLINMTAVANDYSWNIFSDDFAAAADAYTDLNFGNPPVTYGVPFGLRFYLKYRQLRNLNPEWTRSKCAWEASRDVIHLSLDVFGLIPVGGEIADLVNGVLYTIEGDGLNATLSYASAIPIAGWASVSVKYAIKIKTFAGGTVKLVWKVTANGIDFGNRSQLRKVLGLVTGDARQAHHIIPWGKGSHPAVQKAAKSSEAFHLNEAMNGIPLSTAIHNGSHAHYDSLVQAYLDAIPSTATPDQAYNAVKALINNIKTAIQNNPGVPINQINF